MLQQFKNKLKDFRDEMVKKIRQEEIQSCLKEEKFQNSASQ